jgi:membrane protease YdiL (CAAX protease family)
MLSNVLWTALHAYSWAGVASVFLAGVILSWLVWRTGSIKPAIVAHAVGNLFALGFTYVFATVPV